MNQARPSALEDTLDHIWRMQDVSLPIGIFDSGFGGLTVMRALVDQLPNEDFIYLGDTARAPYGPRKIAQVREFALQGLDYLASMGVKAIVIACNSASAAMLRDARERYRIPILEVILPAARRAATASRNGRVGVICTKSTARSRSYDDAFAVNHEVTLYTKACPRFVEFVEAGITSGDELLRVAHEYLDPLRAVGIDTLILGCTHYPLLSGVISYVMGPQVTLVSSAEAAAQAAYSMLTDRGLVHDQPRTATRTFLTTGDASDFRGIGRRLLGEFVTGATQVRLNQPTKRDADVQESHL